MKGGMTLDERLVAQDWTVSKMQKEVSLKRSSCVGNGRGLALHT